jgi:hypothetical protein
LLHFLPGRDMGVMRDLADARLLGGKRLRQWNWPPYAGSGGGMPGKPICSYVREPYRHKPGKWVYQCH